MSKHLKHTPPPWSADLHHTEIWGGRTYGFIRAGAVVPIAAVTLGVEGMPQDEGRANAHLIGAALDLYAALTALRQVAVWDDDSDRTEFDAACALADAACAKAEGR